MGLASWIGRTIRLTDGHFWRGFFGLGTNAGETVTVEKALQLDAAWACIKLVSETVGTLPCMVYEKDGATVASNHPLYEILHDQPNADDTAVEFWEGVVLSLMLYGNAVAEKKMNGGRLVALDLLNPEKVRLERNDRNERVYSVTEEGVTRKIKEDRIFHVRGMKMPGCDLGMSPIAYARQTMGSAIAAEKTAGKMFSNGMQPSGILTTEKILTREQREQVKDMLSQYSGSDKAGKVAVFEAGFNYHQISMKPEDAQMLQTRQFGVEQICRWFGVPPVMIGHASNGVTMWGSGVEQLILQFTKTGLRPILKRIEAAVRRDLMSKKDRSEIKVEFNMEGLLRGDSITRAEFLSKMRQNGIYTSNEARAYENKPPVDGGDELTVQANLVPLSRLGEGAVGQSLLEALSRPTRDELADAARIGAEQALRNLSSQTRKNP